MTHVHKRINLFFYSEADSTDIRNTICYATSCIDPFDNDIIRVKALKSVSFVLNKFSQIANIEPKLTTHWHKRVNNFIRAKGLTLETSANILFTAFSIQYPREPYVHTLYVLPPCRCRPKLVLTGTCIRNEYM